MMAQPYATAMTGLGKVATFVQEQVHIETFPSYFPLR